MWTPLSIASVEYRLRGVSSRWRGRVCDVKIRNSPAMTRDCMTTLSLRNVMHTAGFGVTDGGSIFGKTAYENGARCDNRCDKNKNGNSEWPRNPESTQFDVSTVMGPVSGGWYCLSAIFSTVQPGPIITTPNVSKIMLHPVPRPQASGPTIVVKRIKERGMYPISKISE